MIANRFPQVVTVALNPALDQTIEVAGLQIGGVNHALRMRINAGGKAVNVAACLADFGLSVAITGQLGRDNAEPFNELFQRKQIANHCCFLDGLIRTNTKLVDNISGETTDLNLPGSILTPEVATELLDKVLERLNGLIKHADWLVLSGSLPPGMPINAYAIIIEQVQKSGVAVLLDTSSAPLKSALTVSPRLVKPNRHELAELFQHPLDTLPAVIAAGQELLNRTPTLEEVVVSLGEQGALFLTRGQALYAHPLPVTVTSTVGAGDAMVAGLVAAHLENRSPIETAQLATAFAAAYLTRLDSSLPPVDKIHALAKQVVVVAV